MKLPAWMRRKGGGKRQRRKKAQSSEQASGKHAFYRLTHHAAFLILAHCNAVAADGTTAPAPLGLQHSLSLQSPASKRQQIPLVAVSFVIV